MGVTYSMNRLCTSSVQGCYRVMTRLNGSTEELLCQVFRQREQLGRAAASLFAQRQTLYTSHLEDDTTPQYPYLIQYLGPRSSLPLTKQDVRAETSFTQAQRATNATGVGNGACLAIPPTLPSKLHCDRIGSQVAGRTRSRRRSRRGVTGGGQRNDTTHRVQGEW